MRQFLARSHNTYWLPRLAIEPSRTAVLPVRSQISRAISGVSRVSGGRFMKRSACWMLLVRDESQERGLFQLHRQPLAKGLVKYRIAGLVFEIGQNNRVLRR